MVWCGLGRWRGVLREGTTTSEILDVYRQVPIEGDLTDGLVHFALSELAEVYYTGEGVELIRDSVRVAMQEMIDAEATAVIGVGRYERAASRVTEGTAAPIGDNRSVVPTDSTGGCRCAQAVSQGVP